MELQHNESLILRLLRKNRKGINVWDLMRSKKKGGVGIVDVNSCLANLQKHGYGVRRYRSGRIVLYNDPELGVEGQMRMLTD